MKKAIVTGANGFLGGALVKRLLSNGVKVIGIGTDANQLSAFQAYGEFTPVIAIFSEYANLPEMIADRDIDVFYHFAWAGGFTSAIRDYKLQMSNAGYAGDALTAAKEMGVRKFVYANTYNQYEIINFLTSEAFEPRYTCIYSAAKTAAGLICRTLAYNLEIEYCAALVPMPYGENNYSKQLVNVVVTNLLNGIPPKLVEGNNLYDLVYIDDIARAFEAIGERGKDRKEYYVGHRKLQTFREWMIQTRDCIAPEVALGFGEYHDKQQIDYSIVDLDALYNDTGFECRADFKTTMQRTAQWIRENLKD